MSDNSDDAVSLASSNSSFVMFSTNESFSSSVGGDTNIAPPPETATERALRIVNTLRTAITTRDSTINDLKAKVDSQKITIGNEARTINLLEIKKKMATAAAFAQEAMISALKENITELEKTAQKDKQRQAEASEEQKKLTAKAIKKITELEEQVEKDKQRKVKATIEQDKVIASLTQDLECSQLTHMSDKFAWTEEEKRLNDIIHEQDTVIAVLRGRLLSRKEIITTQARVVEKEKAARKKLLLNFTKNQLMVKRLYDHVTILERLARTQAETIKVGKELNLALKYEKKQLIADASEKRKVIADRDEMLQMSEEHRMALSTTHENVISLENQIAILRALNENQAAAIEEKDQFSAGLQNVVHNQEEIIRINGEQIDKLSNNYANALATHEKGLEEAMQCAADIAASNQLIVEQLQARIKTLEENAAKTVEEFAAKDAAAESQKKALEAKNKVLEEAFKESEIEHSEKTKAYAEEINGRATGTAEMIRKANDVARRENYMIGMARLWRKQ